MNKKVLECPYCKSIITENDHMCPKCGADCNKVIKEYQEELAKEQEEARKKVQENIKKVNKQFSIVSIVILIAAVLLFVGGLSVIVMLISNSNNKSGIINKTPSKQANITGNINKQLEINNSTLKITNFEEYEYYDDFFEHCNTKEGYAKVAFKVTIQNDTNEQIQSSQVLKDIKLKAEDEMLDKSALTEDKTYCNIIKGKTSYNKLPVVTEILPQDSVSGYIGYSIPTDKETITFIINNNETIKVDNPVYKK